MSDLVSLAYAEGLDEAYNGSGENLNPFDELTQADRWKGYEDGYNHGLDLLVEDCQ